MSHSTEEDNVKYETEWITKTDFCCLMADVQRREKMGWPLITIVERWQTSKHVFTAIFQRPTPEADGPPETVCTEDSAPPVDREKVEHALSRARQSLGWIKPGPLTDSIRGIFGEIKVYLERALGEEG
jgi:hypothetical protein